MAEKVPLNVNGDNNGGVVMFSEVMVPFVSDRERNGVERGKGKSVSGSIYKGCLQNVWYLDPCPLSTFRTDPEC